MFLKLCKFLGKHQRWSLYNLMFKRDSSTCVFWWILQKLSEYLFYWTPGWLLLTFYCNGKNLIKKNLSDVSTIGCLVFFDIFLVMFFLNVYSWVYFSHWGCRVFLSTWNLKIRECYRKNFQLNHIQTLCFFFKML